MQTIFSTPHTSNFSILDNALINEDVLTIKAKAVLIYLLSKPTDWQLRISDIKRKLHIGSHSARSALKNLMQAGYVFYKRLASGHTIWTIYDKPQNKSQVIDIQPQTDNPYSGFQPVIVNTEKETNKKTTTGAINPPAKIVVVSLEKENQSDIIERTELTTEHHDLVYPDQLDARQRKTARHIIKTRLKEQKMAQEILFALGYAMTSAQINSVPAYLNGLINASNAGTFTGVKEASTKPPQGGKPLIPVWIAPVSTPTPKDKAKGFIGGLRDALRGV